MAQKSVLIFGATGDISGATAREMMMRGWQVRAVTRNPHSEQAQMERDLEQLKSMVENRDE